MKQVFFIAGSVLVVAASIYYVVIPAVMRAGIRGVYKTTCSLNMREILKAARETGPDELLPTDFVSMSNELKSPKWLICPSDSAHRPATNWVEFTPTNSSYVILAANIRKTDTNSAFLRCNIHGFVGYADGRLLDNSGGLINLRH